MIAPRLIAISGFIAGIGGNGPGNGGTAQVVGAQVPLKFWDGNLATKAPMMIAPNSGSLGTDSNYFIDRDDSQTCPGSPGLGGNSIYDCDKNGLTFLNGVYGNSALFTEGGLYIFHSNLPQPISLSARVSLISYSKVE